MLILLLSTSPFGAHSLKIQSFFSMCVNISSNLQLLNWCIGGLWLCGLCFMCDLLLLRPVGNGGFCRRWAAGCVRVVFNIVDGGWTTSQLHDKWVIVIRYNAIDTSEYGIDKLIITFLEGVTRHVDDIVFQFTWAWWHRVLDVMKQTKTKIRT